MIYRGKVTAVTSTTATVLVPDLDPQQSFGPLSCVGAVPAVGDIVLVVEVGDNGSSLPDLVVVNPTTKSQLDAKVAGPSSSTDNAIARYDGTTGKVVQNSGVTVDDSAKLTCASFEMTSTSTNSFKLRNSMSFATKRADGTDQEFLWPMWSDDAMYMNYGPNGWYIRNGSSTTRFFVSAGGRLTIYAASEGVEFTSGGPRIMAGANTPEGAVSAPVGSLWLRTDGSTSTTLYVKTSGTGNTGWTAK